MHAPLEPLFVEWKILHKHIFTHYDGLTVGLFFASVHVFASTGERIRRYMEPILFGLAVFFGALTFSYSTWFLYSFVAIFFGIAAWHCLTHPTRSLARLLSWPGFQIISRLSYGMYLWYRFPLWRIARGTLSVFPNLSPISQFFVIFGCAFVASACLAALTYVFIESPFLKLRARLSAHSSPWSAERIYGNCVDYAKMALSRR